MRIVSVSMGIEEIQSLAEKIATEIDCYLHSVENRTNTRVISRGKNKGKVKSDLHFILRPIGDRYRSCQNRGTHDSPSIKRTAYVCWMGYVEFARKLSQWWHLDENEGKEIEMYAGGKKYATRGALFDYIEKSLQEYWSDERGMSGVVSFNKRRGQSNYCMCVHGMIDGQTSPCYEDK